jgi:hypothetical protein
METRKCELVACLLQALRELSCNVKELVGNVLEQYRTSSLDLITSAGLTFLATCQFCPP